MGQHLPAMQVPPEQSALPQQSELAMHAPLHSLKPLPHWNPHAPFEQVGVALATVGHAVQLAPHELTLVSDRQSPLQACVPAPHVPMQDVPLAMQAFAQGIWLAGQLAPHDVPSHVAAPPWGAAQAVHDVPHDAGEVSSAQPPLQA